MSIVKAEHDVEVPRDQRKNASTGANCSRSSVEIHLIIKKKIGTGIDNR